MINYVARLFMSQKKVKGMKGGRGGREEFNVVNHC